MQFRTDKKSRKDISIQEPIDSDRDGNSLTLNDVVADDFSLHEEYEEKEERRQLVQAVAQLAGRERKIIILRYGLTGQPPLTQMETAKQLHISRSYVSRIEKRTLEKLRGRMEKSL